MAPQVPPVVHVAAAQQCVPVPVGPQSGGASVVGRRTTRPGREACGPRRRGSRWSRSPDLRSRVRRARRPAYRSPQVARRPPRRTPPGEPAAVAARAVARRPGRARRRALVGCPRGAAGVVVRAVGARSAAARAAAAHRLEQQRDPVLFVPRRLLAHRRRSSRTSRPVPAWRRTSRRCSSRRCTAVRRIGAVAVPGRTACRPAVAGHLLRGESVEHCSRIRRRRRVAVEMHDAPPFMGPPHVAHARAGGAARAGRVRGARRPAVAARAVARLARRAGRRALVRREIAREPLGQSLVCVQPQLPPAAASAVQDALGVADAHVASRRGRRTWLAAPSHDVAHAVPLQAQVKPLHGCVAGVGVHWCAPGRTPSPARRPLAPVPERARRTVEARAAGSSARGGRPSAAGAGGASVRDVAARAGARLAGRARRRALTVRGGVARGPGVARRGAVARRRCIRTRRRTCVGDARDADAVAGAAHAGAAVRAAARWRIHRSCRFRRRRRPEPPQHPPLQAASREHVVVH